MDVCSTNTWLKLKLKLIIKLVDIIILDLVDLMSMLYMKAYSALWWNVLDNY